MDQVSGRPLGLYLETWLSCSSVSYEVMSPPVHCDISQQDKPSAQAWHSLSVCLSIHPSIYPPNSYLVKVYPEPGK